MRQEELGALINVKMGGGSLFFFFFFFSLCLINTVGSRIC